MKRLFEPKIGGWAPGPAVGWQTPIAIVIND
jgi:hypothetical protein